MSKCHARITQPREEQALEKGKEKELEKANIEKFQLQPDEEQALGKAKEKESEEANKEKFQLQSLTQT